MSDDFMRFMAMWALVHESADDGWKAAVERGQDGDASGMGEDPDAFVDGLAAMIAEEKDRLKESLGSGEIELPDGSAEVSGKLDELSFSYSTSYLVDFLSTLEKNQSRDGTNTKFTGSFRVVVNIHFNDGYLSFIFNGKGFNNRTNGFTGATPWGPEINETRGVRTGY